MMPRPALTEAFSSAMVFQALSLMERIVISILVEPKPGFSDENVKNVLTNFGAEEIEVLSPGFISAKIPKESMKAIEFVAYVHQKQQHK